jgi:hypothetical protein
VQPGDSLELIAAAGGSEPGLVLAYNRLEATPQVGRELLIPRVAGRARSLPERARQRRGGYPEDYLPWVRTLPATRTRGASGGSANIDYLAKVPYRSVGR